MKIKRSTAREARVKLREILEGLTLVFKKDRKNLIISAFSKKEKDLTSHQIRKRKRKRKATKQEDNCRNILMAPSYSQQKKRKFGNTRNCRHEK